MRQPSDMISTVVYLHDIRDEAGDASLINNGSAHSLRDFDIGGFGKVAFTRTILHSFERSYRSNIMQG